MKKQIIIPFEVESALMDALKIIKFSRDFLYHVDSDKLKEHADILVEHHEKVIKEIEELF